MHGISARLGVVARRSVVVSVRRICVTGIDLSHHAPTNKTLRRVRIGVWMCITGATYSMIC